MARIMDAAALRRLADALDRIGETTAQTSVELCAYGTDHIEIDGVTIALQSARDDDTVRYVVDLAES